MLCEICGQKEAIIHIEEYIDGQRKTIHLCQDCANEKGLDRMGIKGINLAEILYNLSTLGGNLPQKRTADLTKGKPAKVFVCEYCGWDSEKFQKTGRLGCEQCYEAFSDIILKAISNIQKGNLHIGKRPGENSSETSLMMMDLLKLQKQLEECIITEEYEKAAVIRDKINELKENIEVDEKHEK